MYKFYLTDYFLKRTKKLQKRFRHLKDDLILALESFDERMAESLGHNLYKLRCRSRDMSKGKSGSLRLVVFIYRQKNTLLPIVVYFKGDQENISKAEIIGHLSIVLMEVQIKNVL